MAISGSCLCGGVAFEIRKAVGPVEICHCNRCRKRSGTNALTTVGVLAEDYSLLKGAELIKSYSAPILYSKPAYLSHFCSVCGGPVPPKTITGEFIEIPAGLFDDDPGVRPDKHIFMEFIAPWDTISDDLPQYSIRDLVRERHNRDLPSSFELRSHYDLEQEHT